MFTLSDASFLVKVVILSAGIGAGIKYLLPALPIVLDPSLGLAVALLVAPALFMAVLLWGWSVRQRSSSNP